MALYHIVHSTINGAKRILGEFPAPGDVAALAVGDSLLLPEVGSIAPRVIVDGRFGKLASQNAFIVDTVNS